MDKYLFKVNIENTSTTSIDMVHIRPGEPGGMSLFGKSQGEPGEVMGKIQNIKKILEKSWKFFQQTLFRSHFAIKSKTQKIQPTRRKELL